MTAAIPNRAATTRRLRLDHPVVLKPREPAVFTDLWHTVRAFVGSSDESTPAWPPTLTLTPTRIHLEAQPLDVSCSMRLSWDRDALLSDELQLCGSVELDWNDDSLERLENALPSGLILPAHPLDDSTPKVDFEHPGFAAFTRRVCELEAATFLTGPPWRFAPHELYALLVQIRRPRGRMLQGALDLEPLPQSDLAIHVPDAATQQAWPPPQGRRRVHGRERLLALAPLLPYVQCVHVHALSHFLPTYWILHLGATIVTFVLPGWHLDDPVGGAALHRGRPTHLVPAEDVAQVQRALQQRGEATLGDLSLATELPYERLRNAAEECVHQGLAFQDLATRRLVHRVRFGHAVPAPTRNALSPEWAAALGVLAGRSWQDLERGSDHLRARIEGRTAHVRVDGQGIPIEASCTCTHRKAPPLCRHILALRERILAREFRTL